MANAERDQNNVPTLLGVSLADGTTPVTIYADPITHRLLVDANASSIAGLIAAGTNVTITGLGTSASPYVINASGSGGGTPGGSSTQLQYNNVGAFGGISGATTDGTNTTFAAATLQVGGAGAGVGVLQFASSATSNTITLPAINGTLASLGNAAQTFTGSVTFSTTVTMSGASLNLGSNAVASTAQLAYGATTSGFTKAVNIGTGGLSGSTTNINLGSTVSGALGTIVIGQGIQSLTATNTAATFSTINGVALTTGGSTSLFLNQAGTYTTPSSTSTFLDGSFTLQNTADNTKQALFNIAPNATGTTTTYSLPTSGTTQTFTLVTTAAIAQTFSGAVTFNASNSTFGGSSGTTTYNYGSGSTTSSATKTLNFGTGGVSGSTTTISIGSSTSGALGSVTINTPTVSIVGVATIQNVINPSNALTATTNAATIPITNRITTVTNNSAAALTVTLTTTGAVDGQMSMVRIYDFSAVAETVTWVNTENSAVSVPSTSNGSTTLPITVGFQYNAATSKWRCIASC